MTYKNSTQKISVAVVLFSLVAIPLFSAQAVSTWVGNSATPPASNADTPVTAGSASQTKSGALIVGGIRSTIDGYFDGNVGIGTTTPTVKLSVNGTVSSGGSSLGQYHLLNASGALRGFFENTGSGIRIGSPTGVSYPMVFTTAGVERGRFDAGGNFGVGSTSPSSKLTVAGDINFTGNLYNNGVAFSSGASQWTTAGNDIYYNTGNVSTTKTLTAGKLALSSNTTSNPSGSSTIDNSPNQYLDFALGGNVGLSNVKFYNVLSPNSYTGVNLRVNGGVDAGTYCLSGSNCITAWNQVASSTQWTTNGSNIYYSSGNVGIGTTTPFIPLDVYSTTQMTLSTQPYGYLISNGAGVWAAGATAGFSIRSRGRVIAPEYNATSDARLKNVQFTLDPSIALNLITKLEPVSFKWKNNPNGQPIIGLLAQSVETVIPNAVSRMPTANFSDERNLDYNQLTAVLIAGIKGLAATTTAQFEQVNNKIQELSTKKLTGITLYDTATGKPYCLQITNGSQVSREGECATAK